MTERLSTVARLFKRFCALVDEIDSYRTSIDPESRTKSKKLSDLYDRIDILIIQLKRLGTV